MAALTLRFSFALASRNPASRAMVSASWPPVSPPFTMLQNRLSKTLGNWRSASDKAEPFSMLLESCLMMALKLGLSDCSSRASRQETMGIPALSMEESCRANCGSRLLTIFFAPGTFCPLPTLNSRFFALPPLVPFCFFPADKEEVLAPRMTGLIVVSPSPGIGYVTSIYRFECEAVSCFYSPPVTAKAASMDVSPILTLYSPASFREIILFSIPNLRISPVFAPCRMA